jgi:hypothetical protein
MLNEPSLAILIDCWDIPPDIEPTLYNTILDCVANDSAVNTIILASYNCKKELTHSRSVWYTNNHALYGPNNPLRKIKELNHVHRLHVARDTTYDTERTHPSILNYTSPSKFQIAMHWAWQLEYYLHLNPEIKNVYVFGVAWDRCVRNRTLGYLALTEIQGINVLTKTKCVLTSDLQHPNLDLDPDWVKVADDTYQYVLGNKKVDS